MFTISTLFLPLAAVSATSVIQPMPTAEQWAALTSQGFTQAITGIVICFLLGLIGIAIRINFISDTNRTKEWQRQFDLTREDHREDMAGMREDNAKFRDTIQAGFKEIAESVTEVMNHIHHMPHPPAKGRGP
jgi:hypothetical protein